VPPPAPRALIRKADVPRWYELGWRFMACGICVCEWQYSCAQRRPEVPADTFTSAGAQRR
jgi:hypothetical protein